MSRLSPMPTRATYRGPKGDLFQSGKDYEFLVFTSLLGFFKLRPSIRIEVPTEPGHTAVRHYKTITDFIVDWLLIETHRFDIPVPFISTLLLSGDVVGDTLKKFGITAKPDCGCPDRQAWFNALVGFVPMKGNVK